MLQNNTNNYKKIINTWKNAFLNNCVLCYLIFKNKNNDSLVNK